MKGIGEVFSEAVLPDHGISIMLLSDRGGYRSMGQGIKTGKGTTEADIEQMEGGFLVGTDEEKEQAEAGFNGRFLSF